MIQDHPRLWVVTLVVPILLLPASAASQDSEETLGLSLRDAILRAFHNHPDLRVAELDVAIRGANIPGAKSEFDPRFTGGASYRRSVTPTNEYVAGTEAGNVLGESNARNLNFTTGVGQRYFTGTQADIQFESNANKGSIVIESIDFGSRAEIRPRLGISVTQPLLKGVSWSANLSNIRLAEKDAMNSRLDFRLLVETVLADVENRYWELVFARENVRVQEASLETAQEVLRISDARFKVGDVSELEVITARSEVATRQEAIIKARNDVENAGDRLAQVIFPPDQRTVGLQRLVATDEPSSEETAPVEGSSIARALENRPDLAKTRNELEQGQILLQKAEHEILPTLNLRGTLGTSGLGLDPGNALSVMLTREFYDWGVSLNLEVPLGGNRAAKSDARKARHQVTQAEIRLRKLETDIRYQVREAVRGVDSSMERIRAAEAARILAERRLEVEKAKLEQGASIARDVLEAQETLLAAQSAENRARIDHRLARVMLQQAEATLAEGHGIQVGEDENESNE
jgi:outer membrane protein TolC